MRFILITMAALFIIGCEYVPRDVYEIKTVNGKIIKLACPSVDARRSELTYMIDGDCVVYK